MTITSDMDVELGGSGVGGLGLRLRSRGHSYGSGLRAASRTSQEFEVTVVEDKGELLVPVMTGRKRIRMGTRCAAGKRKAGFRFAKKSSWVWYSIIV